MDIPRLWENKYIRYFIVTVVAFFASMCACNAANDNHEYIQYFPVVTQLLRVCFLLIGYCVILFIMGLMCSFLTGIVSKIIYKCHKKN